MTQPAMWGRRLAVGRRAPSGTTDGSPGGRGGADKHPGQPQVAGSAGRGGHARECGGAEAARTPTASRLQQTSAATQPEPMTPPPMEPAAWGTLGPPSTPATRDSRPCPPRVSRELRPPPGPAPALVPAPHAPLRLLGHLWRLLGAPPCAWGVPQATRGSSLSWRGRHCHLAHSHTTQSRDLPWVLRPPDRGRPGTWGL